MFRLLTAVMLGIAACAGTASGGGFGTDSQPTPDTSIAYKTIEIDTSTHGITELGIERTQCVYGCPVYSFIARSDGTFRYSGAFFVDRIGVFTGKISQYQFVKTAQFIAESGYTDLKESYVELIIDAPTTVTQVAINGERKFVRQDGAGPATLWAVEMLIDDLLETAQWDHPAGGAGSEN